MIPLFIISAVLAVLGVLIINRDEDTGGIVLGLGLSGIFIFGMLSFSLNLKLKTLREEVKNVQYMTALDVAEINKKIAHIKAHPFMYALLNTEGIEYIKLDNAEAIPFKGVSE